jgi:hypothetical protein
VPPIETKTGLAPQEVNRAIGVTAAGETAQQRVEAVLPGADADFEHASLGGADDALAIGCSTCCSIARSTIATIIDRRSAGNIAPGHCVAAAKGASNCRNCP